MRGLIIFLLFMFYVIWTVLKRASEMEKKEKRTDVTTFHQPTVEPPGGHRETGGAGGRADVSDELLRFLQGTESSPKPPPPPRISKPRPREAAEGRVIREERKIVKYPRRTDIPAPSPPPQVSRARAERPIPKRVTERTHRTADGRKRVAAERNLRRTRTEQEAERPVQRVRRLVPKSDKPAKVGVRYGDVEGVSEGWTGKLSGLTDLQRAVVMAEVLGSPMGVKRMLGRDFVSRR